LHNNYIHQFSTTCRCKFWTNGDIPVHSKFSKCHEIAHSQKGRGNQNDGDF